MRYAPTDVFGRAAHDQRGDVATVRVPRGADFVQSHGGLPSGGRIGPVCGFDRCGMADLSMRPEAIQTNRGLLREILIAFLFEAYTGRPISVCPLQNADKMGFKWRLNAASAVFFHLFFLLRGHRFRALTAGSHTAAGVRLPRTGQ